MLVYMLYTFGLEIENRSQNYANIAKVQDLVSWLMYQENTNEILMILNGYAEDVI